MKGEFCCLQGRVEELKTERKTVEGQVDMARNELKKTQDLLKMLTDSKTVPLRVETLHAITSVGSLRSSVVIDGVFVPTRASSQASTCRPLR